MTGLKVQDYHGRQVIDSRDVAVMVERGHNELMKTILNTGHLYVGRIIEYSVREFFSRGGSGNNRVRRMFSRQRRRDNRFGGYADGYWAAQR